MAQPARIPERGRETPPVDPAAVAKAYRLERAKRYARMRREQERRLARLRFWLVLVLLTGALAVLSVTVWNEFEQLFGL